LLHPAPSAKLMPRIHLLPDMVAVAPSDVALSVSGERRTLRFSTQVMNRGLGPLEIRPGRSGCKGQRISDQAQAFQRIFLVESRQGRKGPFTHRSHKDLSIGCTRFHKRHHHWHFEGVMEYQLVSATGTAKTLTSRKVGFCLLDMVPPHDSELASYPVYRPPDGHHPLPCRKHTIQGLSPGWSDVYGIGTPGQSLRVGPHTGDFCLTYRVDPADVIEEADESNNSSSWLISLAEHQAVLGSSTCTGDVASESRIVAEYLTPMTQRVE
jgi:hypothetical protein